MEKIKLISICIAVFTLFTSEFPGQARIEPDGTYLYATKDSTDLFLDLYNPAPGSQTSIDGNEKPCILFIFGGGFKSGSRDASSYEGWYEKLAANGYKVIAIDYRLGLKDAAKVGITQIGLYNKAIHMAVEDLYSATAFIADNSEELGVNPDNIVVAGSSAGAITALQADWEMCNNSHLTYTLPEGLRYKGIISYAGAIFSMEGKPRYDKEPAPTAFFHGTSDKLVTYKQLWFFNLNLAGTNVLVPVFKRGGYNYNVYRFEGNGHEIAGSMEYNLERTIQFIETNVMRGEKKIVDTTINDPSIPVPDWFKKNTSLKDLYN